MLGQVSFSNDQFKDLQIRTTVVPFVAIGVAAGVGYLYFKPKIDLVMKILDILQRVFPFLQSSSGQVSGFKRYPFMKRTAPLVKVVVMKKAMPPAAKNANDVAVSDGGQGQFEFWVPDDGFPPLGTYVPEVDSEYLPSLQRRSGFYKYVMANTIVDELG
jgi:hypothetical protein